MPDVSLIAVVDPLEERAREAAAVAQCLALTSLEHLPGVDLAVVASPTPFHADAAKWLMTRGISVLIEKPLASSTEEAEQLISLASSSGVRLAVGHIERFNPAFELLKGLVTHPVLMQFERMSPYTPRIGDSVVFDLMVHDLDLACWIAGATPVHVQAAGTSVFSETLDVTSAILTFADGCIARIDASRATQDKVRRAAVSEPERFIVADCLRQDITIKRQVEVSQTDEHGRPVFREASVMEVPWMPRSGEPLVRELEDFVAAVRTGCPARVTGEDGLAAIRLAQQVELAARRS
jgi:UDP-N-acetylglucosamine 3-dehydrogenase